MRDDEPIGTDGWVDTKPRRRMPEPRLQEAPNYPLVVAQTDDDTDLEVQQGKAMAILAYASLLFGLPVFLIPLIMRDNAFALHHAKAAGAGFLLFFAAGLLTFVSCGLFFPLVMLCYVPALIGVLQAANGQLAGTWGLGNFGEAMFKGIQLKEKNDV